MEQICQVTWVILLWWGSRNAVVNIPPTNSYYHAPFIRYRTIQFDGMSVSGLLDGQNTRGSYQNTNDTDTYLDPQRVDKNPPWKFPRQWTKELETIAQQTLCPVILKQGHWISNNPHHFMVNMSMETKCSVLSHPLFSIKPTNRDLRYAYGSKLLRGEDESQQQVG